MIKKYLLCAWILWASGFTADNTPQFIDTFETKEACIDTIRAKTKEVIALGYTDMYALYCLPSNTPPKDAVVPGTRHLLPTKSKE